MSYQREEALKLLKRFPNTPSLTLAKRLARELPAVFVNVDSARTVIRSIRGTAGNDRRAEGRTVETLKRPPGKAGEDVFGKIPKGRTHFAKWESVKFAGPMRALILSDLHIPFHDEGAVSLALRHGARWKADHIFLNGDTADFFSCSFWEKDPRERDFKGELQAVREFLTYIREKFPTARIVFKVGNHEERFERYMRVKAPELLDCAEFSLEELFWFERLKIECVKGKRPIALGNLNVIHGHEYRFSISNPVNPARGFFLRAKVHCLGGHLHQSSQHSEKNLEGNVVSTWSTGCLCDLHPDYAPVNNWNHGFATVEVDSKGAFSVENHRIIHGKIW